MPHYGETSRKRLSTCSLNLQKVFNEVIKHIDCTIVEGVRSKEDQNEYFEKGKSRVVWPDGKHNVESPGELCEAVDAGPYINGAISWKKDHCLYFAGVVMGIALMMGIKLRWGGDWDMDHEPITDQEFQDLVHFEEV